MVSGGEEMEDKARIIIIVQFKNGDIFRLKHECKQCCNLCKRLENERYEIRCVSAGFTGEKNQEFIIM